MIGSIGLDLKLLTGDVSGYLLLPLVRGGRSVLAFTGLLGIVSG